MKGHSAPSRVIVVLLTATAMLLSILPSVGGAADYQVSPEAPLPVLHVTDSISNLVVEVSDSLSFDSLMAFAAERDIDVPFHSELAKIITLDSKGDAEALSLEIASIEGVLSISSERKVRSTLTPTDPGTTYQWALGTVDAYEAWDIGLGTHDVVVAILDTGIDWNHPDLEANMWSNANGYHGYNFIDDNWYPMDDNIHGYDDSGDWQPNIYTYHGTHVAGIVGAVTNNAEGMAGLAQIQLVAVKVMNESGEGTDAMVASGIAWAVEQAHADMIVMSLGVDGESTSLRREVNDAKEAGVVMVAAAGNDGTSVVSYPAAYSAVIAVGATDSSDRRASFSNYGANLDVMAPGVSIYSTQGGGGYQYLSGTSAAAPHVAGVAALMLSVNPALTTVEIGETINATATDIAQTGYDPTTGWGIVNAFDAVEQVSSPRVTITEYPEFVEPNSTYSISWMVSGGDPGEIEDTTLMWGETVSTIDTPTMSFSGSTWQVFTVDDLPALPSNGTMYLQAFATVDGSDYESEVLALPVHEAPPDNIFMQLLEDVQDFIMEDMGLVNFLIILAVLIAIPIIIAAARPKRRRAVQRTSVQAQQPMAQSRPAQTHGSLSQYQQAYGTAHLPPPPPPPPRFESYVDIVGDKLVPPVVTVVEGTKIVWVNRAWAPPPGVAVKSGRLDQSGEHPDGLFGSGLLVAPGDYWSVTFHRVGTYDYYLTGYWKTAKVIVQPLAKAPHQPT
ncbi:MAG: S8 family serine peptidase [Thermoplasmata archaeon]|nr:S8 family serine peptidase [Thermoplasmata archaeon]